MAVWLLPSACVGVPLVVSGATYRAGERVVLLSHGRAGFILRTLVIGGRCFVLWDAVIASDHRLLS